jgi:poly-gamma-glutamate capsule biosynthesis protein CapA/YwtB (metallophosphatase superfamily)
MPYLAEDGDISMALSGDAMLTQGLRTFAEPEFLALREIQREADVSLTNLEMTYHGHAEGTPQAETEWTPTCAHPRYLEDLKWFGVDAVAFANNHAFDYGEGGMLATMDNLDRYGIRYCGAGRNLDEARMPCYVDTPRGRVAMISCAASFLWHGRAGPSGPAIPGRPGISYLRHAATYTAPKAYIDHLRHGIGQWGPDIRRRAPNPGGSVPFSYGPAPQPNDAANPIGIDTEREVFFLGHRFVQGDAFGMTTSPVEEDVQDICRWIRDAQRQAPWVVVTVHTHERGRSRSMPPDFLVEFAHRCIDEGADVFFGHGPHLNWGMEVYKGKPILYSVGNFIYTNNTLDHISPDAFVRMGLDPWTNTPADFFDIRKKAPYKPDEYPGGYAEEGPRPRPGEGLLARVQFRKKTLQEVRFHPLDMRLGSHRGMSGRPLLATGEPAAYALGRMKHLSGLFGVDVSIDGDVGYVRF